MNETEKKPVVTVKNILKVLSAIVAVIVFCPTFMVSCSGQNMNVSVMTAVGGVKSHGETLVSPHPIMLIALLLPVAMLVVLFLKKFTDNKVALITTICGAVDFVIWLIFRSSVKKIAEDNMCSFKSTGWFTLNIISLIAIIVLSVLVVAKILHMQEDLLKRFSGEGAQDTLKQMSEAVGQMSDSVGQLAGNVAANVNKMRIPKEDIIGYCSKCGSPLVFDNKFCTSCGTPVPESMIAEAEAARKAAEEARIKAEEEARKAAEEARIKAEEEARKAAEEARIKAEEEARKAAEVAEKADTEEVANVEETKEATAAGTKFCAQCGSKLDAGDVFCSNCGAKVE